MRLAMTVDAMYMQKQGLLENSMDSQPLVREVRAVSNVYNMGPRTLADRCKSVGSVVQHSERTKSALTAFSNNVKRTLSRTDIKLLEKGDQPLKGMFYYILYTVLYSLCFLGADYLYLRNPDLNPFQMLMMRSAFALTFQVIFVNKDLKPAVWDGVDRQSVGPLIFRSI